MDKKIIISCLLLLGFSTLSSRAVAQTISPTETSESVAKSSPTKAPVTEEITEQISNLKEKIASRVAELRLVEKRGIVGIVEEVEDTQITIEDMEGNARIIDVDEITKFASPDDDDSFGISDINKGDKISALGRYNKQSERLLARFIDVISVPEFMSGTIGNIDEDDFSFVLTKSTGGNSTIDVERTTRSQSYDGGSLKRAGFTDLAEGNKVFVTGYIDKDDDSRVSASRVLIIIIEDDLEEQTQTASPSPTKKAQATISPTP